MIDIMHPSEISGSEAKQGHGMAWAALVVVFLLALAVGGGYWWTTHKTPTGVVTPAESLAAVKAADTAWSKAAAARDVNGVLSYYADGASVMPPNQELVSKKSDIRKVWTDMLLPGTEFSWTPGSAEISASGDMVYQEGYYIASTKAVKAAKPALDRGKYLSVWKKQEDGSWKAVANMWSSDLAAKK